MDRRTWLEGVTLSALALAGSGGPLGALAVPGARTGWHVIDGLCILADLDEAGPPDQQRLQEIRQSGLTAINSTTPSPGDNAEETFNKINKLKAIIDDNPELLRLVLSAADLERCRVDGRLGVIIGFQSTDMFVDGLPAIDRFHVAGARIMQMTYNGPGLLGHGCLSESTSGLTGFGREALARMQELGVLVDVSHANRATTADTIASARRPVVISHTGCNAVYRHPRNNDDAQLRALAERGGVAGIYLMPFLDGGSGELHADMLFAHLEHALQVCGNEHVGIGSDQGVSPVTDGPEYRERLRAEVEARRAAGISAPGESPDRPPFIPEFNRSDRLLAIADAMTRRGHRDTVIEAVIGGNFARVMGEAWR